MTNIEDHVLSACLKSRESFELSKRYLAIKNNSREFQLVFRAIEDYYDKDTSAKAASPEVIVAKLHSALPNPKHQKMCEDVVSTAAAIDVSTENINDVIINAKKKELAALLAVSLVNKDGKETELLEEYRRLQALSSVSELEQADDLVVVDSSTIHDLINAVVSNDGAFQLYPRALNNTLNGRLNKGHHVVTYGLPELGKTALNCTFAAGFCRQNRRGIYFLNEDKEQDAYFRIVSCLIGWTYDQIRNDPVKAIALAKEHGIDNLILIGMAPGSLKIIDRCLDKYDVEWSILDQLINLNEKGDGPTQILERSAKGYRNLVKASNTLGISTCQAGDSAEGKAVLDMGDVYMSNTGIPASCDVLIGLGANKEMLMRGERIATFCKNKITGDHSSISLQLNPHISRYTSG